MSLVLIVDDEPGIRALLISTKDRTDSIEKWLDPPRIENS
jgi:hypothetical protein